VPEIKQIGGRAGRYRAANTTPKEGEEEEPNVGLVSCLEEVDLPYIQYAMKLEPPPLSAAGIMPTDAVFRKLAAYFPPGVPFEYLVKRVLDIAQVSPLFFMCDPKSQLENAEVIDTVQGLPIEDQLKFMVSPMDARKQSSRDVTGALADCVADHNAGHLLDIPHLNLEVLEQPVSASNDYMHELESLHRAVILYLWLSFRFGGTFTDRTLASHVKELVEERMVRALTEFSANKKLRKGASLKRQIALQKQLLEHERLGVASGDWALSDGEDHVGGTLSEGASEGETSDSVDSEASSDGVSDTETSLLETEPSSATEPSSDEDTLAEEEETPAEEEDTSAEEGGDSWYDAETNKRE
jgi:ATP-dependent RNA helicase SUPV3L1/SUV3